MFEIFSRHPNIELSGTYRENHKISPVSSKNCEIIISDGNSQDKTRDIVLNAGVKFLTAPKGRGSQLMEGYKISQGQYLLFLHSDTVIASETFHALDQYFEKQHMRVGKFLLRFDTSHGLLSFYSYMAKFDSFWTSFGDQGIAVRRDFFEVVGGFPDWPLLEDVRFFQNARRLSQIRTIPACVTTSAGRFIKNGVVRQQVINAGILIKYMVGHSVHALSAQYEKQ